MNRRVFLAATASALAGCGRASPQQIIDREVHLDGFRFDQPWNSPFNEARARAFPAPLHSNFHGLAISPDGGFMAIAIAQHPGNQLSLIDLKGQSVRRLVSPHPRLVLMDPAFSPDGRKLAMVAAPQTGVREGGISQVYIVDLDTGAGSRFGAGTDYFRHPTFSADGSSLAYWKEAYPAPNDPGYVRADYAVFHRYALHERSLRTGVERQLDPLAFYSGGQVFYDPRGRGLFFQAMDPANDFSMGRPPQADLQYYTRIGYRRTFLLRTGMPLAREPEPYVSVPLAPYNGEQILSVVRDGRILVQVGKFENGRGRSFGAFFDGTSIHDVIDATASPYGLQGLACSREGDSFVGVSDQIENNVIKQTLWWRPAADENFHPIDIEKLSDDHPPEPIRFD